MKRPKLVAHPSNLVPLLPRNKLAPNSGYDTLLDDWLARSRSPHTKRMYRSNIKVFFEYLGYQLTSDILAQFLLLDSHQAFELVSQYHGSLIERSLSPATINQKLAAIKSLVNYASSAGKCHYTLTNIKAEKLTQYRDTKGIFFEQFKLMLDAVDTDTIKGLRDRSILLLGVVQKRGILGNKRRQNQAKFEPGLKNKSIIMEA